MLDVKQAKDLRVGDRAFLYVNANRNDSFTVESVVPGVLVIERKVLIVTLRGDDGAVIERRFSEHSPVRIVETTGQDLR